MCSVSVLQTTVVGTAAEELAVKADAAGRVIPAARQIASHTPMLSALACREGSQTNPIRAAATATAPATSQPINPSRSLPMVIVTFLSALTAPAPGCAAGRSSAQSG